MPGGLPEAEGEAGRGWQGWGRREGWGNDGRGRWSGSRDKAEAEMMVLVMG